MKQRMRTVLVGLPLALALGCSSNIKFDQAPITSGDNPATSANNVAVFNPSAKQIPLPNILLTAAADAATFPDGSPYDITKDPTKWRPGAALNPIDAMIYVNQQEMGRTQAVSGLNSPVYLQFGAAVDPATVNAATVKIYKVLDDTALGGPQTENTAMGFQDISPLFAYQTLPGGKEVQAFPKFPLEPGTKYLYAVTDGVHDAATGLPIGQDTTFGFLKYVKAGGVDAATDTTNLTDATDPGNPANVLDAKSRATLEGIRGDRTHPLNPAVILLRGYGKTMWDLVASSDGDASGKAAKGAGATGIGLSTETQLERRSHVKVLGRFITTGAGYIQTTASPSSRIPVETALRLFSLGSNYAMLGGLPGKTWTNNVIIPANDPANGKFYTFVKGTALSPDLYFNAATGGAMTTAPASVGAVVLGAFQSADLNVDHPFVKASGDPTQADQSALVGAYAPVVDTPVGVSIPGPGLTRPFRDASGNLLAFYHTNRMVNFYYIAPAGTPPSGGWPVVIYQHGVTSFKETGLGLAQGLTANGYALLAIDLPLHGANAWPSHAWAALDTPQQKAAKAGAWGSDFMSIGAPLGARTNMQNSILHLDRLEILLKTGAFTAAVAGAGLPQYRPDYTVTPKFVGVSLGSIVGAYYLAGNTTLDPNPANPLYTQTSLNNDMKGYLSVPGGKVAYLLQNSPLFGGVIDAGLASAGIPKGSPTYNQFFVLTQAIFDPVDPATHTTPLKAGLPSRLSGRVVIQEACSTTYDASNIATNGDQVIPNFATRYFANALGGREILGLGASPTVQFVLGQIAPNFKQLAYTGPEHAPTGFPVLTGTGAGPHWLGVNFLYTLSGGSPALKTAPAATFPIATPPPTEGYFQFDQPYVHHTNLVGPQYGVTDPAVIAAQIGTAIKMQKQMIYFFKGGLVVDPYSATVPMAPTEVHIPNLGPEGKLETPLVLPNQDSLR